jgi:hypothetical protein
MWRAAARAVMNVVRAAVSTGAANLVGHRLQLCLGATGEEHPRALASEGPGDRAADRPAPSVDHRVLVFEQHLCLLGAALY